MKPSGYLAVYPLSTDIELSSRDEKTNRFVDNLPSVIAHVESSRLVQVCLGVADSDDGMFSTSSGVKLGCDIIAIGQLMKGRGPNIDIEIVTIPLPLKSRYKISISLN